MAPFLHLQSQQHSISLTPSRGTSLFQGQLISNLITCTTLIPLFHVTQYIPTFQDLDMDNCGGILFCLPHGERGNHPRSPRHDRRETCKKAHETEKMHRVRKCVTVTIIIIAEVNNDWTFFTCQALCSVLFIQWLFKFSKQFFKEVLF